MQSHVLLYATIVLINNHVSNDARSCFPKISPISAQKRTPSCTDGGHRWTSAFLSHPHRKVANINYPNQNLFFMACLSAYIHIVYGVFIHIVLKFICSPCSSHYLSFLKHICVTRQGESNRGTHATWRHRSGSTLAQVMACCLTAPSQYLNQCWLIIS